MKINSLGKMLKHFLQICLILGGLFLIFFARISLLLNLKFEILVMTVYPCGICFLILIYQFIGLFDSLMNNDPFSKKNVIRMKRGEFVSLIISIILGLSLFISIYFYHYTNQIVIYALIFISILFFGVFIALYILSELFKTAIYYKEENELTI